MINSHDVFQALRQVRFQISIENFWRVQVLKTYNVQYVTQLTISTNWLLIVFHYLNITTTIIIIIMKF